MRLKANEEKFLTFASKHHLEHPAYNAEYIKKQKLKKQKQGEKNKLNSPRPKNKENIQNKDVSSITD
jgi:hypothetical protein